VGISYPEYSIYVSSDTKLRHTTYFIPNFKNSNND
jgi:hypothetical protein